MKLVSAYQNQLFLVQTNFLTVLVCSLNRLHQLSQSHCHRCHHFQGMYLLTQQHLVQSVFNSSKFCRIFSEFLTESTVQKGRNSSILFGKIFGTSSSPFDLLKDIFTKEAVSTCFLDLFQAHNLLVETTLFSSNSVHACNLNNKTATWLHSALSLK